ncbi:transcriptional regulator [Mergibacter septicus]|uniref:Transcriptional regulator n=1 Tax=Mergibacter septicus TaxID=221402 RepID=A0A8E3MFV6_9PAST|nr:ROK family protein [Mergibacter septicus]AWX15292.1 transcriptional regulator [Mergibacter septicus]QDJ14546.1 transcriptional regulator [Mergibacter septicus]UTU48018.1 ROK family protein [Mergibacter septicus]WMR96373.1 ROK family protein [Mergibacter septicus]
MPRTKNSNLTSIQNLGEIYRLIEQFELISRIDLSKLSGFAPASITNLIRKLIDLKLVIERTAQTSLVRGRPAVGLTVSPFYWQTICGIISEQGIELFLCELNGNVVEQCFYPIEREQISQLDKVLLEKLHAFQERYQAKLSKILALSISVIGQLNRCRTGIVKLGSSKLELDLQTPLSEYFSIPILLSEYFSAWVFAESTFGSAINSNNVIFLQLDDVINMSVLSKGEVLHNEKEMRMNIDRVCLPKMSPLAEYIGQNLPKIEQQQLQHHVTYTTIYRLVDHLLPNTIPDGKKKLEYLCQQVAQNNQKAIDILYYIADNLSYILMNLVNIFSSEKIIVKAGILGEEEIFLQRLKQKLNENLLLDHHNIDIVTGHYNYSEPEVATATIKQYLYNGRLLEKII